MVLAATTITERWGRMGAALQWQRRLTRWRAVLRDVVFDSKFLCGVVGRHVPNASEDWTQRRPRSVEAAERPKDAAVGVRVTTVDRVFVVQLDHHCQRGLW